MKVQSGIATGTTSTGFGQGSPASVSRRTPDPLMVLLFGKRPARRVDRRKYPGLKKAMSKLRYVTDEIAEMLGHTGEDFALELCEGKNASINRDGQISIGVELLEEHQGDDDLLVAVLGHEIGHQPWQWPKGDLSSMTRAQLNQMYREEEAKADRFMGRVLAELGASPDSICQFLLAAEKFESSQSAEYYPAKQRASMIREAYRRRKRVLEARRSVLGEAAVVKRELR